MQKIRWREELEPFLSLDNWRRFLSAWFVGLCRVLGAFALVGVALGITVALPIWIGAQGGVWEWVGWGLGLTIWFGILGSACMEK